nr:MAG TPA: portal protein [Caudoviricetes sp.]
MDKFQQLWWGWFTHDNEYYKQPYVINNGADSYDRLSISPASMVASEIPSLVMNEGTILSSSEDAVNDWLERTIPNFVDEQAEFISTVFALGVGAWVANFHGYEGNVSTSIDSMKAWQIIPLLGDGCAFISKVTVNSKLYDQLQLRYFNQETQSHVIETLLFNSQNRITPVEVEGITGFVDTKQPLPTYALVKPAKYNAHDELTPLGSSVIEDICDSCRLVDEAFNQMYWQVRVSLPKMVVDEQAIVRDKDGKAKFVNTMDQIMFAPISTGISAESPMTVYNPDTHIDDMVTAFNNALAVLGFRTGFGAGYWSFTLGQGLKTATEVVSTNATLIRTIRKHEHSIENSVRDLVQGAFAAECTMNGYKVDEPVPVDILWDDSVISDDKADRDMMKDDIARGLCPKWKYLVKYQGMSEEDAKAFTSETGGVSLDADLGE